MAPAGFAVYAPSVMQSMLSLKYVCKSNEMSRIYFLVNMDNAIPHANYSVVKSWQVSGGFGDICSRPFPEAEELYQKRVLTITGICIALLVVGIMCVVAYCKTK